MAWSFGKRLQHARIERGFSQRELAQRASVRQSHLSMLEHERHYPNAGVIRRLAHVLGINTDYLLGLTTEMCFVEYEELEPAEPMRV
jgi:transcriptional regulator with XRE-family HTH domain